MIESIYQAHKYKEGDVVYVKFNPSSCNEEATILDSWHEENGKCYYKVLIHDTEYENGGWTISMEEKRIHCKLKSNPNVR